jgi:hypothetical protein
LIPFERRFQTTCWIRSVSALTTESSGGTESSKRSEMSFASAAGRTDSMAA